MVSVRKRKCQPKHNIIDNLAERKKEKERMVLFFLFRGK
jgi:hypothetical protein